jgi:TRAP-type C4-dicarboxylate transport system permease small subunit
MNFLDKINRRVNQAMVLIAGIALAAMILLTIADIGSRLFWAPIKGTVELIGFFGAVAAAFTLGFTQMHNGHTAVDILVQRFSPRVRRALQGLNAAVGAAFFSVAGWQLVRWGTTLWRTGELTETLRIAYHPVVYTIALGCFLMSLVLLADVLRAFGAPPDGGR